MSEVKGASEPLPHRSLLTRLVGSFLALSFLSVLFVSLVAFAQSRSALRDLQFERLESVATRMERELVEWVDVQQSVVVFLASVPQLATLLEQNSRDEVDPELLEEVIGVLASADRTTGDFEELNVLAGRAGKVIASTNAERHGEYHVTDMFFTEGKKGTFVESVYTSPMTGRPALTIASPIEDSSRAVVGVLAGHLELSRFDDVAARSHGMSYPGEAYLVSSFGDFVSSRRFGRAEFRRGVSSVGIDAALERKSGFGEYENYAGVPVIGAYRWNDALGLAILVEMERDPTFAPVRSLFVSMLLIGIVSALLLGAGVIVLSRRIAAPVLALASGAERVASGDFSTRIEVQSRDEVGLLAAAFNEMTSRLRDLYRDLNEQVEAKSHALAELEKSKQLLQAIIDNSITLIGVSDRDGRLLLVNGRLERLAAARGDAETLPAELAASARECYERNEVIERELAVPVRDSDWSGSAGESDERTFFVVCFPLLDRDGIPYAVGLVGSDLTERIRAHEAQKLLEAQVLHAQKLESLGLMAGGIAHDFNNILTTLSGNAELALEAARDEATRGFLEKVLSAARQASQLTGQMLAYAGRAGFDQEDVDLNEVVAEVVPLLSASVAKKITLTCRLAKEPTVVHANRAQLIQLVLNLATNAAEAIGDRRGQVTLCTRVSDSITLEVTDDGAGMDAETRARIFDPFFSTKGPGRGIGLAAVIGIVKAAAGSLTVASEPGGGTTFRVELPRSSAKVEEPPAVLEPSRGTGSNATVLVVDDESTVRDVTRKFLELGGYRVIEAIDGQQAVDIYRERGGEIDAVLLDLTMPVLNGVETLAALREIDPDTRALLTSGYDARGALGSSSGVQPQDVLQKPFRAEALLARIGRLLGP